MRNKMATASITVTEREKRHTALSARIAAEGMVLLENKGVLPFPAQVQSIALFGSGARRTVKGGTGSGDVNVRSFVTIEQGLKDAGYGIVTEDWLAEQDTLIRTAKAQYDAHIQELSHQGISVALLTMMGKPFREPELRALNEQDLRPADAAIYVLARNSGEGADRKNAPGDYLLTETEKQDIALLAKRYERFVLLLNVGGVLNLEAVRELPGAIVLVSQGGSGFGTAVAEILTGAESPSGRLTATWAKQYSDYPCADEFCVQPEDVWYKEGIFVGYRWFDSFGMEPRYPFGYGLSYTDFAWSDIQVHVKEAQVFLSVTVQNTGNHPGKDVVQIYAAQPRTELPKAEKLLVGFAKTGLLNPGEGETVTVSFPCASLASYDEEKSAWVLEQGEYGIYVGKNSRKLQPEAALVLERTIATEQCRSLFRGEKADRLFPKRSAAVSYSCPKILIDPDSIPFVTHTYTGTPTALSAPTRRVGFSDVVKGSATAAELAGELTPEELALLCIGAARVSFTDFSVIGNASKSIPGAAGDTTDRLEDYGIPQCAMADGPAGIRVNPKVYQRGDTYINNVEEDPILGKVLPPELRKVDLSGTEIKYQYCTALPVAVQLAQSWNPRLAELAGDIAGAEMEELGIDLWLAPGLNIQRNPLCGRNFEYYSEDPYLSGVFAAAVTKGVQKHPGKGTCIKHLAANNQETCRSTSNSHVSERTLREIYLRGFEICVKEARPFSAMTSMNLLNGVHTANDQDLLTHALRDEWGFDGIVMTDWGTTGQFVCVGEGRKYGPSTPVGCILAGNDLIMPGTKFDEDTLFAAIRDGSLPVAALQDSGKRLIELLVKCNTGRKG